MKVVWFDCCGIEEQEQQEQEDGEGVKVKSLPVQVATNRAEQLAWDGTAWNGTGWFGADVTCCRFLTTGVGKTER